MQPRIISKSITYIIFGALLPVVAWAQGVVKNDPHRPVGSISRDLGVTPEQFVVCFNDVNPAPAGTRPTSAEVHDNKAHLLPCLQQANPAITHEMLDTVMDRYRPGGHEAQNAEH